MEEIKKTGNEAITERPAEKPQDAPVEAAVTEKAAQTELIEEKSATELKRDVARTEQLIEKKQEALQKLTEEIADLEKLKADLQTQLHKRQAADLLIRIQQGFDKGQLQPDQVAKMLFDDARENPQPKRTRKKRDDAAKDAASESAEA